MQHDYRKRLCKLLLIGEKGREGSHHDSIVAKENPRPDRGKKAVHEYLECNKDIIPCNHDEHEEWTFAVVYIGWITLLDILQRHVNITITKNEPHEGVIIIRRHCTNGYGHDKNC